MEFLILFAIGFLIRGAMEHSKGDRAQSRDQRVKEVAKTHPKGSLTKSQQKAAARRHATGWWAREVRHGFPVHRTGWHAAWLAHKAQAHAHDTRREEAAADAAEAEVARKLGVSGARQRRAAAQAELDKIEAELAGEQAKGSPATGKEAVQRAADEVSRKRKEREQATGPRCPGCGAPEGYDHLAGCDPTVPPLPASGVRTAADYPRSTMFPGMPTAAERATRRVDGQPETEADKRFFDHRESGYDGPLDKDGNIPPADDPDVATLNGMREQQENEPGPDAARNPEPVNTTASPTTQGAPVSAETTYRQVLQYTDDLMAGTEVVAVQLSKDVPVAMQVAEDLQGAEADGATISAQMELADRLRTAEASLKAIHEQAEVVKNAVRQHSGLQEAHDNAPVRAAHRDFYSS